MTDPVSPSHYYFGDMEVGEMMKRIWGAEAYRHFCLMNAFKYRMRCGKKSGQDAAIELQKAKWYETKAKELLTEIHCPTNNSSPA